MAVMAFIRSKGERIFNNGSSVRLVFGATNESCIFRDAEGKGRRIFRQYNATSMIGSNEEFPDLVSDEIFRAKKAVRHGVPPWYWDQ